jgi:SnoaL-like domain
VWRGASAARGGEQGGAQSVCDELAVALGWPSAADDEQLEAPAHPAQGFTGRDQVRRNWEQFFAVMPDLTTTVLRSACDGEVVWSEWEMTGTRPDGSTLKMAGVIIFGVASGQFTWARFYVEPVQAGGAYVSQALRQRIGADARPAPGPPV